MDLVFFCEKLQKRSKSCRNPIPGCGCCGNVTSVAENNRQGALGAT